MRKLLLLLTLLAPPLFSVPASASPCGEPYTTLDCTPYNFSLGNFNSLQPIDIDFTGGDHVYRIDQDQLITLGYSGCIRNGSPTDMECIGALTIQKVQSLSAADARTSSAFTPSLVTSTSGGGTQISSTKASTVRTSITINTSVSLSGNATGYVVAEIAATNSSTVGDWTEVGRSPSGQSGTLVIGLTLNQTGGGQVSADVPAGYYVRYRSVNTAGTPTYTVTAGQKTIYG